MKCTHYACRCARANELAVMADRTNRMELYLDAIAAHDQEVPCRAVPTPPQDPEVRA